MDLNSNFIEENYSQKKDIKYRRSLGQFFTPFKIAQFMSEWILKNVNKTIKILDPAAGFGIFERALKYENEFIGKNLKFDLWEVDHSIVRRLTEIIRELNVDAKIFHGDFLNGIWGKKYDGIIANPPYYKHHNINNKNEVYEKICLRTSYKFSVQTNIYCWFLIKSLNLLNDGGRLAFIVPSEFLNANYGEKIKDFLRQSGLILHLINVNFKENIFENALTTSLIILGKKTQKRYDSINFYNVSMVKDLMKLQYFLNNFPKKQIHIKNLNPKFKWRIYFTDYGEEKATKKLIPFTRYGAFSRGIATGANKYFTLTKNEIKNFQIPNKCLIPCITKANHVQGVYFREEDYEKLYYENKKVFLFDGEKTENENCRQYIKRGEALGIPNRYLTQNRKPWYALEKRTVSRIWAGVFGRKGLKFIWNETDCLTLTCFHVFYPTKMGERYLNILFLYLNTEFAKKWINKEKREYGNGLEKFEPNDINKSYALDFNLFEESQLEELKKMQKNLRVANEKKQKEILQVANEYFKKTFQSEKVKPSHQLLLFPQ